MRIKVKSTPIGRTSILHHIRIVEPQKRLRHGEASRNGMSHWHITTYDFDIEKSELRVSVVE
jgi:hypothetical protein